MMRGSRPLTDDEVKRVQQSFTGTYAKRNRALFTVGVRTGFRMKESDLEAFLEASTKPQGAGDSGSRRSP